MVEGLDWIFVGKVAEKINSNSNQKLHVKSYILRGGGGGQHISRAPTSRYPAVRAFMQHMFAAYTKSQRKAGKSKKCKKPNNDFSDNSDSE